MIRIATFNAENLFTRFRFKGRKKRVPKPGGGYDYKYRQYTAKELEQISREGWEIDKTFFDVSGPQKRVLTAEAIAATQAGIVCLQEIENLDVLRLFNRNFVSQKLRTDRDWTYRYALLIDGNDPRLIDVAVLSRYPFDYVRSHQWMRIGKIGFSRDCLEVGFKLGNETLVVFVNHFKSMIQGREKTMEKRRIQTTMVTQIIESRFRNPSRENFVVLGDFNDHRDYNHTRTGKASPGIAPLLNKQYLVDLVYDRLPLEDRWTQYWAKGDEYQQLDYILVSRKLADANSRQKPLITRDGLPKRATRYTGHRFEEIEKSNDPNLKASDHCPVSVSLSL